MAAAEEAVESVMAAETLTLAKSRTHPHLLLYRSTEGDAKTSEESASSRRLVEFDERKFPKVEMKRKRKTYKKGSKKKASENAARPLVKEFATNPKKNRQKIHATTTPQNRGGGVTCQEYTSGGYTFDRQGARAEALKCANGRREEKETLQQQPHTKKRVRAFGQSIASLSLSLRIYKSVSDGERKIHAREEIFRGPGQQTPRTL